MGTEIYGKVIYGKQIARKLGYPTANINIQSGLENGIYMGYTNDLLSIIYITTDVLETHIINWSGDLYGLVIKVNIKTKLRNNILFNCYDDIITQIHKDVLICTLFKLNLHEGNTCLAFSGGKEACVLVDLLHRLEILDKVDIIHFKPKEAVIPEHIETFLKGYNKKCIHIEYTTDMYSVIKDLEKYDYCYLGVRYADNPEKYKDGVYKNNWLEHCKLITPLINLSYKDIWVYIDYFNVHVSKLYGEGYTSVGYNSKPNELLRYFDNTGYKHARDLDNIVLERKNI
jgi:hypothetical protein